MSALSFEWLYLLFIGDDHFGHSQPFICICLIPIGGQIAPYIETQGGVSDFGYLSEKCMRYIL